MYCSEGNMRRGVSVYGMEAYSGTAVCMHKHLTLA